MKQVMSMTKKNHINPCFWTALWNLDYLKLFMRGEESQGRARDQLLNSLEIKSNKLLVDKAENIHYEKYLGVAEMTPEKLIEFCKRNHPDQYDTFLEEMKEHPETLYLDFENIISGLEQLPIYKTLLDTVRHGEIKDMEKSWLALFLTHHVLRSHVYIKALTDSIVSIVQGKNTK